ncbi:MAG: DUF1007 family protein [Bauldia sp.]|nr:DUF1007 family protein [Bauldia sp.]
MKVWNFLRAAALALGLMLTYGQAAGAHPHVFIDTIVEVIFDDEGRMTGVHEIWLFDYEFGDVLKIEADKLGNNNGRAEAEELPLLLANNKLSWMSDFNYFTRVTFAGRVVEHLPPETIDVRLERTRVVMEFTLPLAEPLPVVADAGVDVFDGEYYYDFAFGSNPVRSVGLPTSCGLSRRTQANVDPMAVMLLRRLGLTADPAILNDPAAGYAVRLAVNCAA